jgi:hypothetical protein
MGGLSELLASLALFASFAVALPGEVSVRRDSAPLFNRDRLAGSHVRQVIMLSAGPIDINAVNGCCLSQAKGQYQLVLGEIAAAMQHLVLRVAAFLHTNDSANPVAI